ncbi:MAG: 7-cyano-7-deazaguanine synthase QueC [bacterium]|nr:7-cyano-7-deazaguanine synthase QueC [bacterium]
MQTKPKAISLLSGGIDSTTATAIALADGYEVMALSFDYGQRHFVELIAAKRVAVSLKISEHVTFPLDLDAIGGSSLTDKGADIPKDRAETEIGQGIPSTYVPARNIVFLSIALAFAESRGAERIYIGANAIDYSGYPDCRPEFLTSFERMANLGTKAGIEGGRLQIVAPLLQMTKAEILRTGTSLGVDYSLTFSCYDPDEVGLACGHCDSCQIRRKGFAEAGLPDPTRYQPGAR